MDATIPCRQATVGERRRLVHRRCPSLVVLMAWFCLAPVVAAEANEIYDFESLAISQFIDGRDNWVDQPGQGRGIVVLDTEPENGTKVVSVLPTVGFNESAFLTRVNDPNFSFPAYEGEETAAVVQFDLTGHYLAQFALGYDINGDGMLQSSEGEIGPAFGTRDRNFTLQEANRGELHEVAFGEGNALREWYRLQLRIDFTANDGNGSGSVFYRNLSDGDIIDEPIPGLQEIDLNLSAMAPEAGPETWNAMWLHILRGGGNAPRVDHLVPVVIDPSAVIQTHEPHTAGLLGAVAPNPTAGAATIRFTLPEPSAVSLSVFDETGRRIRTLVSDLLTPSRYLITWDGRNSQGRRVDPGVYFFRLRAGSATESRKVTLLQ